MRLGLSFWGVLADFEAQRFITLDTPDGHRYGRPVLIRALQTAGHTVVAMQQRREPEPFEGVFYCYEGREGQEPERFPDLDVLFLEWRWKTWKNDPTHPQHDPTRYEPDLDRQLELIEFYRDKCPIIVWDTDLKVTPEDEGMWPELVLTDPSLRTNRQTRDRISLPFWSDWRQLLPTVEPYPIYGYIGNNYERTEEFQRYYFSIRQDTRIMGIQTTMYGNWLQRSPERESPTALIGTNREVAFNHRMNFYDSMCMMNRFICTTHVSKPRYYETGFISPRYMEALAVNCPALVPMAMGDLLGDRYSVVPGTVTVDAIRAFSKLSIADRVGVVEEQRRNLREHGAFSVSNVVSFIESVRGG